MCNVSVSAQVADYYLKSAQYYNTDWISSRATLRLYGTDTQYVTFSIESKDIIHIGKYNGKYKAIDIYTTMDFTQKSKYLIKSTDDNGYIELVKKDDNSYPEFWIYNDNGIIEKISYNESPSANRYAMDLTHEDIYIGDIDNPYKYIYHDYSALAFHVNYGSQKDSPTANYTVKAKFARPSPSSSPQADITLYDPDGTIVFENSEINRKSLELTSVKDGITTKDLYAASGYYSVCKIQTKDGNYFYIDYSGGSQDPTTYPYTTISKTHTWSPT